MSKVEKSICSDFPISTSGANVDDAKTHTHTHADADIEKTNYEYKK